MRYLYRLRNWEHAVLLVLAAGFDRKIRFIRLRLNWRLF